MEMNRPKIGVGVFIRKGDAILFGLRKGKLGTNTYAPPGGHIEFGETPEEAVIREVYEETGMSVTSCMFIDYSSDVFTPENHYITLYFEATVEGEPVAQELDKCELWEWFPKDELPEQLFLPIKNFLEKRNI